jgi:hypothetical protein
MYVLRVGLLEMLYFGEVYASLLVRKQTANILRISSVRNIHGLVGASNHILLTFRI